MLCKRLREDQYRSIKNNYVYPSIPCSSNVRAVAVGSAEVLVTAVIFATEHRELRPSPRNPKLCNRLKSSISTSLEVV